MPKVTVKTFDEMMKVGKLNGDGSISTHLGGRWSPGMEKILTKDRVVEVKKLSGGNLFYTVVGTDMVMTPDMFYFEWEVGLGRDMKAVGLATFITHYATFYALAAKFINKEVAKNIIRQKDNKLSEKSIITKVDSGLRIFRKYSLHQIRDYMIGNDRRIDRCIVDGFIVRRGQHQLEDRFETGEVA